MRDPSLSTSAVSRRTALAGIGAGLLGLTLGRTRTARAAQGLSTADHPMAGMWLAMVNPPRSGVDPQVPVPSLFAPDGTCILHFVPAQIVRDHTLQFSGASVGVWEPYDERTAHFTVVRTLVDATGKLIGSATIDGYPRASEDGTTFTDDELPASVTIRDVAGVVVIVLPSQSNNPPMTGVRMRVGNPGFPGDETPT